MKKVWENATIEALEVSATAGGQIYDATVDGDAWYNKEQGRWEEPIGHNEKNS